MSDKELLEDAARAAGIDVVRARLDDPLNGDMLVNNSARNVGQISGAWNPLTDDGDALRLAVKLRMNVRIEDYGAAARIEGKPHGNWSACEARLHGGLEAATRRAIVRAAAAIGQKDGAV